MRGPGAGRALLPGIDGEWIGERRSPALRSHRRSLRIPHAATDELLEHAVVESGRPDFPLLAASAVRSGHFGLVELLSHSEPTVEESLLALKRFCSLLTVRAPPHRRRFAAAVLWP